MRIRTKLFVVNALITTLLLAALTYGLSAYASKVMYNKTVEDMHFSVSQLAQNVDNMLLSYEQLVDSLYTNVELQQQFFTRYESQLAAQEAYMDYFAPFTKWVKASNEVMRLTVYTDNPTFQFADIKLIDNHMKETEWYQNSMQSRADIYSEWTYNGYDTFFKTRTFRLIKRIKVAAENDLFVALDFDEQKLYKLADKENQRQRFMIVLPNGQIVVDNFNRNQDMRTLSDEPSLTEVLNRQGEGEYIDSDTGNQYWLTSRTLDSRSSVRGMRVIVLTPLEELSVNVREMERLAAYLCIIAVGVSAILIYSSSSRMTKRLIKLAQHMQKVDYGRLEERMKDTGSRDEVSVLGRKFNDMMARIETLISDVYVSDLKRKELELRRREAEMYALQTQVNPHYLFNTLNALRGSLLEKGDRDNARIVMLLADSFRNVLRQEGHLIRLREECKIVETYLGIQQFRYGERMQYFIDVPESLQDVHIPRLALQTVVENAVIHAVDRSKAKTTIVVEALEIEDDGYMLTVSDDGLGMPPERLADVSEWMGREIDEEEPVNLGLRNTHQRLLALYGEGFGVTVSSTLQKGTSVTLRLRKQPLLDPDD